jgi:hypothetical protein
MERGALMRPSETMTHAYTGVLPESMRDAAERIDHAIGGGK